MSSLGQVDEKNGSVNAERLGVLVLGMHRSGTSVLTNVLARLGCGLPATLLPAAHGNEDGHWESAEIYQLNDELLAAAGSSWYDWLPVSESWYQSAHAERFRNRALEVLHSEFGSSDLFVLKDPRICRLVPFWLEIFRGADIRPALILTIRQPAEVAASLHHRDQFDPAYVKLTWLRHVLDSEKASRGMSRVFTSYDQLMTSFDRVVEKVQVGLGIDWPHRSDNGRSGAQAAIKPSLRHFQTDNTAMPRPSSAEDWYEAAFGILDRWADSGEDPEDYAALDRIGFEFNRATPSFLPVASAGMRDLHQVRALTAQLIQKDQAHLDQLSAVNAELTEAHGRLVAAEDILTRERAHAEQLLASERERADVATRQVASLQAELEEMRDQNAILGGLLASGRAQIGWLKEIVFALWDDSFKSLWWARPWLAPTVRRRQVRRLARRSLFDAKTYLAENADVAKDGADAFTHYLRYGISEERKGPLSQRRC